MGSEANKIFDRLSSALKNHESVICEPKPYYWLFGILIAPYAGLILTAIVIRPILMLAGINLMGKELVTLMIVVAVITMLFLYYMDYTKIRFEVNDRAIILGRYPIQQVVSISEISTAVIGLPDRIPWWISIQRFIPFGIGAFPVILLQRKNTLVLRLSNQRILPICLGSIPFLKRPDVFFHYLLLVLNDKIVSHESYSEVELKALCRLRLNKIINLSTIK